MRKPKMLKYRVSRDVKSIDKELDLYSLIQKI